MAQRSLDTPTAILAAGALIGAGLFFGLRGRSGDPPTAPPAPSSPAPAAPSSPAPAAPSSPEPAAIPAAAPPLTQLVEQARLALEPQRAALVEKCWTPAVKAQPTPPTIHYVFNFTFDAEGHQLTRGVIEQRRTARPDVTRCVAATLASVAIPPPGVTARVDVPFDLP